MRKQHNGFSLVELSVSLAVMGVIGLVVWRIVPASLGVAEGQPVAVQLAQAQAAVEGFVMRNHRLPCPSVDAAGRESCASGTYGHMAWRDLGLNDSYSPLRYGVYRTAISDLATAQVKYTPLLPPGFSSTVVNGLDFCEAVHAAALNPGAVGGASAGGVEVAYGIAAPGKDGLFHGLNVALLDLPGRSTSSDYDDTVVAAGLVELSGRLGCPVRLGQTNAAARAAYAAYDTDRVALQMVAQRHFASEVSVANTVLASVNLGLATVGLAAEIAKAITAVSIALNSAGPGFAVVAGAIGGVAGAVAGEVVATALTVMAAIAEGEANARVTGMNNFQNVTALERVKALGASLTADTKGLNP